MKVINIRKCILALVAYSLLIHSSHAVGLATGPSLGVTGYYSSFDSKQPLQKTSMDNLGLQMGWFAKLDLWLLYTKLDGLLVLDWRKLPNRLNRDHFKYITLPLTIGLPLFGIFRPHIGLVFRLPLGDSDDTKFKGNRLIENYRKKLNSYILGLGIDLPHILIDIYWEFARSPITRKSISTDIVNGNKPYRSKQLTVRVGYNLLG